MKAQVQGMCKPSTSNDTRNLSGNKATASFQSQTSGRKNTNGQKPKNTNGRNYIQQSLRQKGGNPKTNEKHIPMELQVMDIDKILEKEPQKLLAFLGENLTAFTEFLATSLPYYSAVQIVFMMEKICSVKNNEKILISILSQTQDSWMKQLDMLLVKLSLDEEEDKATSEPFWKNPEAFWNSLVTIFETILKLFQNNLTEWFSKVVKSSLITIGFHKTTQETSANEVIINKLRDLNSLLNKLSEMGKLGDCTGNYMTIKAYPNPSDFETERRPFVRQNIIDGRYKNVNLYLDTHFRLLREDFFGPLRNAICTYRENMRNNTVNKIPELHVYARAEFIQNSVLHHRLSSNQMRSAGRTIERQTYKVVNSGNCNNAYAQSSEDFKTGNLLCFSGDNFETMFFGIVAPSDHDHKGTSVNVELFEERPFLYTQTYTMLISTNYFGPYYLVLKALQNFSTDNFPMERYIVNVVNEQEPPAYLKQTTKYTINESTFTVLNYESWPSKDDLSLNEMQYSAFQHALTSKFAIIQGPPGTGKTHLGLKIAQTLIENGKTWGSTSSTENKSGCILRSKRLCRLRPTPAVEPILIVAYTNHALDQFLEGLIPYTNNIVRMGRRSKSEAISKLIFRPEFRYSATYKECIYEEIQTLLRDKDVIIEELENVLLYEGIYNVRKIALVISEISGISFSLDPQDITSWLLGDFGNQKARYDRWNEIKIGFKNFRQTNAHCQFRFHASHYKYHILTVSGLQGYTREFEQQLANKNGVDLQTMFQEWAVVEEDYKQTLDNMLYLQWRLEHAEEHLNLYTAEHTDGKNLHQLSYNDRWILYFHWLDCYAQHLKSILDENTFKLQQLQEQLSMLKQKENSISLAHAQPAVLGMTTSGAALNRHLLENLKCRIVIIEEAAEVLESHIVTSLTSHCEHLILIGDHQQLRPKPADYEIEKQYHLGVSLFERMVRNGVCYKTLEVQHRMRPEIARLIVPAIYPRLENHASTYDFPNILGITHNVYFITHTYPEVSFGNSKKNVYEAEYIIALARHLILQNIPPSEITILTTYKGQLYEIKERQRMSEFSLINKVQVKVVDDFQGEENQIILLSLVRSNNYNHIGFLATENRVCVALSRAKRGFYMIGNMNVLSRSSQIWPKIEEVLKNHEQIGPGLQLACQLHPLNVTIVTKPEDFLRVPEGGCYEPCKAELQCGHLCQKKCHVMDREHDIYRCMQPCTRIICPENHPCPRKCSQTCEPCVVLMVKALPCEHVGTLPCSIDVETYKCTVLMKLVLKCGHSINKPCFEDQKTIKCAVKVRTILPKCGHKVDKPCYANEDTFYCTTVVKEVIPKCGHIAKKNCSYPINEILCTVLINIKPKCGHVTKFQCGHKDFMLLNCPHNCLKLLRCGHKCQNKCHYLKDVKHTAEYRCKETCTKFRPGCKANHKCNLLCSDPCKPCDEPVEKILPCGHSKQVTCRTFRQKHECEQSYCGRIKPCGHVCYAKCHPVCDYNCKYKVTKYFPACGHGMTVYCTGYLDGKMCVKCRPEPFRYVRRKF